MTQATPQNAAKDTHLLAISTYQRMMIHAALDKDIPEGYHMLLTPRVAFRIMPGVSPRALKHAFNKLVARHQSLRLRFVQHKGDWKARVLPEHPTGLIIDDLSTLPQAQQTPIILDKANQPKTAFSEDLFETRLIKCGPAGDIILTRAHHSIIDSYSFALIIEDLLKFALNIPLTKAAMTHEEFITLHQQQTEQHRPEAEAFWHDHLIPLPKEPNIGRMAKGLPRPSAYTCGPIHKYEEFFDAAQSKRLDVRARETGISAFCYIYTAFSETLCALAGQDDILIESALGRQDPRLANFVGAAMQDVLLRFRQGTGDMDERARRVQDRISTATKAVPTDLFYATDSWVAKQIHKGAPHSQRFVVHTFIPTGKISASPFSKLFSKAMESRVSMGLITLETVDLEYDEGFVELSLSILKNSAGPNASLTALQSAFSPQELKEIAARMLAKLDLDDGSGRL